MEDETRGGAWPVRDRFANLTLDEDEVIRERLVRLSKERAGIQAAFTRTENLIYCLVKNTESSEDEISAAFDSLVKIYGSLKDKVEQLRVLVQNDKEENERYETYLRKMEFRLDAVKVCITHSLQPLVQPSDSVSQTGAAAVVTEQPPESIAREGGSKTSSKFKTPETKAVLQVKLKAMKKEQELKMKMLKLKEEQIRLEQETLQKEIEIASQIAATEDEDSVADRDHPNEDLLLNPYADRVQLHVDLLPNLPMDEQHSNIDHLPSKLNTAFTNQKPVLQKPAREASFISPRRSEVVDWLHHDHHKQGQMEMQREMLHMLQLPQTQIMTFDGNPLRYWAFIRSFDNSIGETSISNSSKLNRLLQYCVGPAHEVIECCVIMDPDLGYNKARNLLMERFGNPFVIAKAWINKVTEGPNLKPNDSAELRKFADSVRSCVVSLSAMGRLNEIDNQQRMRKIVDKLPLFIQGRWRKEAVSMLRREGDYPRIDHLADFIETVAEELDDPIFGVKVSDFNLKQSSRRTNAKFNTTSSFVVQEDKGTPVDQQVRTCRCCSGSHPLYKCTTFKNMTLQRRMDFVRNNKLCFNCFSSRHMSSHCLRKSMCDDGTCRQLDKKHSNLLHDHAKSLTRTVAQRLTRQQADASTCTQTDQKVWQGSVYGVNGAGGTRIALPIVPVSVRSKRSCIQTYALLDPGSTNSFCSEELVDFLGMSGDSAKLALSTLTDKNCESHTRVVSLCLTDMNSQQEVNMSNVFVLPEMPILDNSSAAQCDIVKWDHMRDINLPTIDGYFAKVTLLIGQDNPVALIPLEVRAGNSGEPYATKTLFGWAINGPLQSGVQKTVSSHFVQVDDELERQVEKFWTMDHMHDDTLHDSFHDQQVIQLWDSSVEREDGHYKLPIPFKKNPPELPNNFAMAQTRLMSLGRKLTRDDVMNSKYKAGIEEMLVMGYAESVPLKEIATDNPVWYIPHHAVTSTKKPDKVRIVFDCSAQLGGVSLNSAVHQGPNLTNSLIGVLIRFREHKVAMAGDIEAMYHRVKVADQHRDSLRFLWWKDGTPGERVEIYRMTSHLFGGIWSASCANYTLKKVAMDNATDFDDEVVNTVNDNFYVDDCLKSVKSDTEAMKLIKDVSKLLQRGKFRITKWISNSRAVIQSVPADERAKAVKDIDLGESELPTEKALGVTWNTETDQFGFKFSPKVKPASRRGLISIITSVFDPLGLLSPLILRAKLIFQEESRLRKSWDAPLEPVNFEKWTSWMGELSQIENLTVPRCITSGKLDSVVSAELHHFADASSVGYGAVSFLRLKDVNGQIKCVLLIAKSRLAPIKNVTIPRLELSAAVLSVKLDQILHKELRIKIGESTFWTDSMIVLHYIRNDYLRYQTFVANRVTRIRQASSPESWRHVRSQDNPADLASRGCSAEELIGNLAWVQGPSFLNSDESEWPSNPSVFEVCSDDLEIKRAKVNFSSTSGLESCTDRLITHFSSWYRLKRAVAWVLRLKQCLLKKQKKLQVLPLTVDELRNAEVQILKYLQRTNHPREVEALSKGLQLLKASPLYSLNPFVNHEGLLCVGGRLQNAPVPESARHQAILPKNHHVVKLIVREHHEKLAHSGTEHVLSSVRQKFWLINARRSVKGVLRECVVCKRLFGQCSKQKMADLPEDRVTPGKPPFTNVGIDCFGPFLVKRGRSEVKRYGCIFTCLTTRAIHLEKLDSLDTDSFLNALRRFEARRGVPEIIRSDNGTNFRGAQRELMECINFWNNQQTHSYMMQKNIKWIFNPPSASHMGGAWERPIRTVRKVLSALLCQKQSLSDEGLSTLLCEIEAIVNSRPITVVSEDHKDMEPLTPNHILLLKSGHGLPPGEVCVRDIYRRRWKHVQFLADQFWKRWLKEYLPSLQCRPKWNEPSVNFKEGDIVLIADTTVPRFMWPLAKVTQVFPGQDGLVRTVEVKTKNSVFNRPVTKLCFLESTHV